MKGEYNMSKEFIVSDKNGNVYKMPEMVFFVEKWEDNLKNASEETKEKYKIFVNVLAKEKNKTGLYAKAYGCYGGNEVFPCDWAVSAKCLKKLLKFSGCEYAANSLGYIYYYGRLSTDGTPDFKKAFHYFTRAAAAGYYEAMYKLADMYKNGYYVAEDRELAYGLVRDVYARNLLILTHGDEDCKFADAAYRMGCFAMEDGDYGMALKYFLEADYAINRRMSHGIYFGDSSVYKNIQKGISEAREHTGPEKIKISMDCPVPFYDMINDTPYDQYLLEVKKKKHGVYTLTLTRRPRRREEETVPSLITVPEVGICRLTTRVTVKAKDVERISKFGNRPILIDEIDSEIKDGKREERFYLAGKKVFTISAGCYEIKNKKQEADPDREYKFVTVTFHPKGRQYNYICDLPEVEEGDTVIVQGYNGPTEVQVVKVFKKKLKDMELPVSRYKKVMGK